MEIKEIGEGTALLLMHCAVRWNESLARFDIGIPGKWPKSTLRYREALDTAIDVTKHLESGDLAAALSHFHRARKAVALADRAFLEDEQMHKDIDQELDDEMGPDK